MQSNLSVILDDHISAGDCSIIATAINEENKKKPHMIAISAEDLLENARKHGGLIARTPANDLIWFVKLTLLSPEFDIYEWGSLMVLPEYRGKGVWEVLIHSIVEKYRQQSLLAVTTEIQVIRASVKHVYEQVELLWANIPEQLRTIIEWPQSLLEDDRVFINHRLHNRILGKEFA